MKQFFSVLTIAFSCIVLLYSCTTTVTDIEIPGTEKLVITGLLVAGEPVRNIQISRSLPPLDTFNYAKIFVGDANVTITVDGQTSTLRLQSPNQSDTLPNGKPAPRRSFYEAPNLIVQAGKTYKLRVEWKSSNSSTKIATAETFIPSAPTIEQFQLTFSRTSEFTTNATVFLTGDTTKILPGRGMIAVVSATLAVVTLNIRAKSTEMYRISSFSVRDIRTSDSLGGTTGLGVQSVQIGSNATNGTVTLRQTLSLIRRFPPTNYILPARIFPPTTAVSMTVQASDSAYYDYVVSNARASSGNNPIGAEGINPRWNVQGDGIGIFIGTAKIHTIIRP